MQSILSSQLAAVQHVPQVADVPSALGQHDAPAVGPWQSGSFAHWPARHLSVVQGSLSLHCESSQHSAQPTFGQQMGPSAPQAVGGCSHKLLTHESVVHGSLSSQSVLAVLSVQACLCRQPVVTEQYSSLPQFLSLGAWVHTPAKQSSSVQPRWSLQSPLLQHSPQVPPQHFWVASHFGARLQVPSAPH